MPDAVEKPAISERALFGILLSVALMFGWLAMGPCLDNGFTNWDEQFYIVRNPKIKSLDAGRIRQVFSGKDLGMYSPLSTFSYSLNYRFSGLDPKAYHATDLLLHLANTGLVMLLVSLLLPGVWTAFFTALLFAVHPAHVESVAWAAERKDVLCAFFYLSSLIAWRLRGKGRRTYLASLLLFVLALLSKPMAVSLPLVLLLADYLDGRLLPAKRHMEKIPFFILSALFAAANLSDPLFTLTWAKRLLLPFYNIGFYIKTLAWPAGLSAMYVTLPEGWLWTAAASAAALAAGAYFFAYRRKDRELTFCIALFLLLLLPVLQFFPFGPVISADRYTYLSSIGLFAGAALLGRRAWLQAGTARRYLLAAAALMAVLSLSVAARVRCGVWKNDFSLWSDTLEKQPRAGLALGNLCAAYYHAGMYADAEACLALSIKRFPNAALNYGNMCGLLYTRGELREAGRYCQKALELDPLQTSPAVTLGDILRDSGEADKAGEYYRRALSRDRYCIPAYLGLASLEAGSGNTKGAAEIYAKALEMDPSADAARNALLSLAGRQGGR